MVEQNLISDSEQMRYDQEDDILMKIIYENSMRARAEEQEKLDVEVKCEAAKYKAYMKKVRRMYHNAARATAIFAGVTAAVTGICLFLDNALGVLIAAVSTCALINLTVIFDRKSYRKKEDHRGA